MLCINGRSPSFTALGFCMPGSQQSQGIPAQRLHGSSTTAAPEPCLVGGRPPHLLRASLAQTPSSALGISSAGPSPKPCVLSTSHSILPTRPHAFVWVLVLKTRVPSFLSLQAEHLGTLRQAMDSGQKINPQVRREMYAAHILECSVFCPKAAGPKHSNGAGVTTCRVGACLADVLTWSLVRIPSFASAEWKRCPLHSSLSSGQAASQCSVCGPAQPSGLTEPELMDRKILQGAICWEKALY